MRFMHHNLHDLFWRQNVRQTKNTLHSNVITFQKILFLQDLVSFRTRVHDRMVVGFTATYAIGDYHQ